MQIAMSCRFDPHLVNAPFGDPGVYVDLVFERRALLFDLGELSPLPPRKSCASATRSSATGTWITSPGSTASCGSCSAGEELAREAETAFAGG